ncbi:MAG: HAD-IIIA family hydrolase [Candidatus Omnitrophota bacterium]
MARNDGMKKVSVVFLDRDGVINEYPGHYNFVTSVSEFQLIPRAREALARLCKSGYRLFIVSNQSGVAKGLYNMHTLDQINDALRQQSGPGVEFDGIYYCIHAPEQNCSCRKPKTYFIDAAGDKIKRDGYSFDRKKTFFVGDSLIDIETGKAAGMRTIMVFSGKETPENRQNWKITPDYTAADLYDAADIILKE